MPDTDPPASPTERGAAHWVGIFDRAHDAIAGKVDARKVEHVLTLGERVEADLGPLVAHAIGDIAAHPDTPDELRPLLNELVKPQNFTTALLVGIAVGAIISPVLGAATAPATQAIANVAWHTAATGAGEVGVNHISPVEAAAGVLKGVLTEAQGANLAAYAGVNGADFARLVEIAGQSIGTAEALLLWRRDQITLEHLQDVIKYSNVNPKFYDDIPKLRYLPPTVGEIITGWLKGHLDPATARTMLAHTGMDPAHADWLHASAGRPPGVVEMLHLWNRGAATEGDIDRAVKQSDINTDYLPFVKELRWYVPPVRSVMAMLRSGAIDDGKATALFTENGVRTADIQGYIDEAHTSRTEAVKALSQSQVTRMYSARFIDRAEATMKLQALRYDPASANLLLDFADDARREQLINATVRKVGTLYVAHKLSKIDAAAALNDATVPIDAQHDLFSLWDIERTANVHVPTVAGIVAAYRRGQLTPLQTKQRLTQLGVQGDDLAIFVADGFPPSKPAAARAAAVAVVNA